MDQTTPSLPVPTPVQTPLLGPVELLKESWNIYRERFQTFIAIAALPYILYIPFFIPGQISGFIDILSDYSKQFGNPLVSGLLLAVVVIIILFIFAGLQLWGQVALLYAILKRAEHISFREAYGYAYKKILSYYWISLLSGIIVFGGYMLFLVPGILFSVWFSFALYILIAEDIKGMTAVLKSREYTRGYFWSIAGRFLFPSLLFIPVIFVFGTVGFIFALIFRENSGQFKEIADLVESIINMIFAIFVVPLISTYTFLLYENVRKVKGSVSFDSSSVRKAKYIAIGILGFILSIIFFVSLIMFIASIFTSRGIYEKYDISRQEDVKIIRALIDNYYSNNQTYPVTLSDLTRGTNTINFPTDPQTKQNYQYIYDPSTNTAKICATLSTGKEYCR